MKEPPKIQYDQDADVLEIEGVKYSADLFRQFGGLMPEGSMFRLVSRDGGVIHIERVFHA